MRERSPCGFGPLLVDAKKSKKDAKKEKKAKKSKIDSKKSNKGSSKPTSTPISSPTAPLAKGSTARPTVESTATPTDTSADEGDYYYYYYYYDDDANVSADEAIPKEVEKEVIIPKELPANEGIICHADCRFVENSSSLTSSTATKVEVCIFDVAVDLFATPGAGYYTFKQCPSAVYQYPTHYPPTLGMKRGVTYLFRQLDITNYKHPLGFASSPSYGHDLSPNKGFGDTDCAEKMTCSAPMYLVDGVYIPQLEYGIAVTEEEEKQVTEEIVEAPSKSPSAAPSKAPTKAPIEKEEETNEDEIDDGLANWIDNPIEMEDEMEDEFYVEKLAPRPPKEEDEEEARQPFIRRRLNQDYEHDPMLHMSIETTIDEVNAEIIAAREEESSPPKKAATEHTSTQERHTPTQKEKDKTATQAVNIAKEGEHAVEKALNELKSTEDAIIISELMAEDANENPTVTTAAGRSKRSNSDIYSNNPFIYEPVSEYQTHTGSQTYITEFAYPLDEWLKHSYSVAFRLNDETPLSQDLFYYCHLHQGMSGRIKLLVLDDTDADADPTQMEVNKKVGTTFVPALAQDVPMAAVGYSESISVSSMERKSNQQSTFDEQCGTFDLQPFRLPHKECPERFVCDNDEEDEDGIGNQFAECVDAMNCAMTVGMTNNAPRSKGKDGVIALFNRQMIPHHVNSVNMAKSLLKTNVLNDCDLTQAPESTSCTLQKMALEIINTQVSQIQLMERMLGDMGIPLEDDCTVLMGYTKVNKDQNPKPTKGTNKCPMEVHDKCPKNAGPPSIHLINKRVNAAAVKVDYVDGLQQNFGFVGKSVTLIAAW
eukprot:CAMPEP_0194358064 /NCGR_PEP_ID=MMETSP0174-20130528/5410_1 /TAXON_ID=216777 /ORGANISM="Proboscia alata, Strain PI-D3" /LENGTH=822 /DNA_ID=CAMNT_0039128291 /DNA_START=277 /DNA_END=2743 /DNA_ORIENTATION=+